MKKKTGDHIFLFILGCLIFFGLAMLASASAVMSYEDFGSSYGYLKHQVLLALLPGIFLFFIASKIRYTYFRKLSIFFLIFTMLLLFLLFLPGIGFETKGAARWIQVGSLTFQPSELLKLTFILYLAAWLESRKNNLDSFSEGLMPFLVICSIIAVLLISQPDLGTLVVVLTIGAVIYFVGGGRISHLLISGVVGLIAVAILIYSDQYRLNRWTAFLNPEIDPLGTAYQINQALIAIGSGGLFGLGFGMSKQKYNYLPEPMGDSIFAVTAEELGFVGSLVLLFLFLALVWRGLKIAKQASTTFGMLVSVGVMSWISIQAIVNIGAISGLLPLTGITLPFISYGGSSLIVLLTAVGIVYNISKDKK